MSIPVGTEDISRFNALESSFGQSTPINDFVVPCIVEMFANKDVTLAYHLRTGPQSLGDAA
jgi:hypothetical protein